MVTKTPGVSVLRLNQKRKRQASAASRKQVCLACRRKKKRCDGLRPACQTCLKNGIPCIYDTSRTPNSEETLLQAGENLPNQALVEPFSFNWVEDLNFHLDTWQWNADSADDLFSFPVGGFNDNDQSLASDHWPEVNVQSVTSSDPSMLTDSSAAATPHSDSAFQQANQAKSPEPSHGSSTADSVPNLGADDLFGLVDLFFERYHRMLPCIHIESFKSSLSGSFSTDKGEDILLYAVIAISSQLYNGKIYAANGADWLTIAMSAFDDNFVSSRYPTRTMQASVWIIFFLLVKARMAETWVWLGKVCRYASHIGFDRVDSKRNPSPFMPQIRSPLELESCRQTMWCLYLEDRLMSSLSGWPLAIADETFMVDYPRVQSEFQSGSFEAPPEPFSFNLASLSAARLSAKNPNGTPLRLLQKTTVLLGRILELNSSLHFPLGTPEYASRFKEIEDALQTFVLVAIKEPYTIPLIPEEHFEPLVWLQITLQMCKILLHHPTANRRPVINICETGHLTKEAVTARVGSAGFEKCLNAMQAIIVFARETANRRIEPLMNPFLVPAWFLVGRFLAIASKDNDDQALRKNIEFMLIMMGRVEWCWPTLADKYKKTMLRDLKRDPEALEKLRVGTGSYLSGECIQEACKLSEDSLRES